MKQIYLLEDLELYNYGIGSKNLIDDEDNIFLQQGSIDGACGPYCLFMALLILGQINKYEATNLHTVRGYSRLGKSLKTMKNWKTLIQDGTTRKNLLDFIEIGYRTKVNYFSSEKIKNREIISFIKNKLTENKPTIVTVKNDNFAHWLLAVGYETDEKDNLIKLFFLDPSQKIENYSYWNASVKIAENYKLKYHHEWIDYDGGTLLKFDECFSLANK